MIEGLESRPVSRLRVLPQMLSSEQKPYLRQCAEVAEEEVEGTAEP